MDILVNSGSLTCYVLPIQVEYKPMEDITAYELSQLLPYFLGQALYEKDWLALGSATRHLIRK